MKLANPAAHPLPANLGRIPRIDPAAPLYIFWPKVSSRTSIGIPTIKSANKYARTQMVPPCFQARYGYFQMLPRPILDPRAAKRKTALFGQRGLLFYIATSPCIFFFYYLNYIYKLKKF